MKKNNTFIVLFCLSFLWVCPIFSQTTYVNENASGSNDGTNWSNAYTDLTDALLNTTTGEVWVAAGTYRPGQNAADSSSTFSVNGSIGLYGGFEGTESNLSDRDVAANPTILDGDILNDDDPLSFSINRFDNVQHVIYVDSLLPSPVTIDGFRIKGGHTSDNNDQSEFFWRGGGIFAYSTVNVVNCSFDGNFARSGASIYVSPNGSGGNNSTFDNCVFLLNYSSAQSAGIFLNTVSNSSITNCTFENNITNRGAFYPLYCDGVTLSNCTFENNNGEFVDGFGGAIFNWNSTGFTISDCTFTENTAGNGGVIFQNGTESGIDNQNLVFENCTFDDNNATDFGGGVFYNFGGSFTMNNCTLEDNLGINGSHLFLTGENKDVVITNTSFEGGQADWGGIHSCYGFNSAFLLENNNYDGGTAQNNGGALIVGFQANVTINNCNFSDNDANFGGAISFQNDSTFASISNSTFEVNSASTDGGAIYQAGGIGLSIDKCDFMQNSCDGSGGGIQALTFNDDAVTGSLDIQNTKFIFNNGDNFGGGLSLIDMNTTITSSVFASNELGGGGQGGGGISNVSSDSNSVVVNLMNCSFASNLSATGQSISHSTGEFESFNVMNIQNSTFSELDFTYQADEGIPEMNSLGGNISTDGSFVWDHPMDQAQVGEIGYVAPLDFDLHLLGTSVAINAGVADGAPLLDIEGNPRIGEVDSGAYEFDSSVGIFSPLESNSVLTIIKNPVADFLNYKLENSFIGNTKASIYNFKGELIKSWEVNKNTDLLEQSIEVKELAAGAYILYLQSDGDIATAKFIK